MSGGLTLLEQTRKGSATLAALQPKTDTVVTATTVMLCVYFTPFTMVTCYLLQ